MKLAYTVALCTHNHADRLARTLADLSRIRSPERAWELVIIDNASTDATPAVLERHSWPEGWQVRVLREEKLGLSNARNRAIREAQGEYILFMDDDETPEPDWLQAYERVIVTENPDAVGGRIEVLFEDSDRPSWMEDELLGFVGRLDHGPAARRLTDPKTPIFGGNFGFRVGVFDTIGGFDPILGRKGGSNVGGEDTEIYKRMLNLGCRVWWVPEAVIHHRIQAWKLSRKYFLDLHYRQGQMEGMIKRGDSSRIPPKYLYPQLWRAVWRVVRVRAARGSDYSLRLEMNVAYFLGYISGWFFGTQTG